MRPGTVKYSYLIDKHTYKMFEVGSIDKSVVDDENPDKYMSIYIRHDNLKVSIKRNEYSILVWLAMLGGIQKLIKTYFVKLTDAISRKFFLNAILRDLFFIKSRRTGESDSIERHRSIKNDDHAAGNATK